MGAFGSLNKEETNPFIVHTPHMFIIIIIFIKAKVLLIALVEKTYNPTYIFNVEKIPHCMFSSTVSSYEQYFFIPIRLINVLISFMNFAEHVLNKK